MSLLRGIESVQCFFWPTELIARRQLRNEPLESHRILVVGRNPGRVDLGGCPGLTHHNSEDGLYGKFRIPNKLKLLPYSLATFR